jgi:signal transduction histidine kinase
MRRCRSITQGLLAGRDQLSGGSTHGPCDVSTALQRASTLVFGTGLSRKKLEVAKELVGTSAGMANDSLVQVFVNLLQNAADVIEGKADGKVTVRRGEAERGRVVVWIDDNGPGLPLGSRARVFEAFFTTKPPGKGTGLGLYTARSLVQEAGGSLLLEEAPGGGARAVVDLPAAGAQS